MEKLQPNSTPNFTSLTEIMERFGHVPYEQFQQELNDWFQASLTRQGIDAAHLEKIGIPNLSDLVSSIYHNAEMLQALSESHIKLKKDEGK